jgi:predicted regulator of Ras-like GTPase activity (Roadblock/LC7/MglB family)
VDETLMRLLEVEGVLGALLLSDNGLSVASANLEYGEAETVGALATAMLASLYSMTKRLVAGDLYSVQLTLGAGVIDVQVIEDLLLLVFREAEVGRILPRSVGRDRECRVGGLDPSAAARVMGMVGITRGRPRAAIRSWTGQSAMARAGGWSEPDHSQAGCRGRSHRRDHRPAGTRGLQVVSLKMLAVDRKLAERHYAVHQGKASTRADHLHHRQPVVVGVLAAPMPS